nr:MAG TPA: hypothetical protein [Caudoviricetes sp.]
MVCINRQTFYKEFQLNQLSYIKWNLKVIHATFTNTS